MKIGDSKHFIHIDSQKTVHQWMLDLLSDTIDKISKMANDKAKVLPQPASAWGFLSFASNEAYQVFNDNPLLAEALLRLKALRQVLSVSEDSSDIKTLMHEWATGNSDALNQVIQKASIASEGDRLWVEKVSQLNWQIVAAIHAPPVKCWSRCSETTRISVISCAQNLEDALSHLPKPYGTYRPPNIV